MIHHDEWVRAAKAFGANDAGTELVATLAAHHVRVNADSTSAVVDAAGNVREGVSIRDFLAEVKANHPHAFRSTAPAAPPAKAPQTITEKALAANADRIAARQAAEAQRQAAQDPAALRAALDRVKRSPWVR